MQTVNLDALIALKDQTVTILMFSGGGYPETYIVKLINAEPLKRGFYDYIKLTFLYKGKRKPVEHLIKNTDSIVIYAGSHDASAITTRISENMVDHGMCYDMENFKATMSQIKAEPVFSQIREDNEE